MNDVSDTQTAQDVMDAVRESAMLAEVSISAWSGERTDREAMNQLKRHNEATGNVGRVIKNLMAGADDELKAAKGAYMAIRTAHYALTLPWVSDPHADRQRGARLLPTAIWDKYFKVIGARRTTAEDALEAFLAVYPTRVEQARAALGGLADVEYPTVDAIRAQFKVNVELEPIPVGAQFKGLPDVVIDRLATNLQRRQQGMLEGAQAAMWEAVRERVGHIAERLTTPDARFKTTTIDHVRELVELLPGWDLTGDTRVGEIADDVRRMMSGVTTKSLREDKATRDNVAFQAKAVVDKLARWGL
jgi:hypothetical protein